MFQILRIFLSTEGPTKWTVLASLVLASLADGIGLASLLPALTAVLGDGGQQTSPIQRLVEGGLAYVGLPASFGVLLLLVLAGIMLKAAFIVLGMLRVGYAVADVATGLRSSLVENLLNVKWLYFTRQPLGRFAHAMSADASRAAQAYLLAMMLIASMLQALVAVTVAVLISWRLALLGVGVGSLIVLILGPLVRVSKTAGRRQQQSTQGLVKLLSDTLVGIKPLKAMARQDHFLRLFKKTTRALRKSLRRQAISEQLMGALREPIFAVFALGGFYIVQTRFTIPISQLIVMAILLERTVSTMASMQRQLQRAVVQEAAYRSVQTIIAETRAERETFSGTRAPSLTRGCALEDVVFGYGNKTVLDGVSIVIPARRLTVLMGPSGVGKTTIIDLLLGMFEPRSGRVLIDGVPLSEIDLRAWRSMVGYVPQELTLFHDTIFANLTLGDPAISQDQAIEALKTAGAWEFVAALPDGLMTTVGERGLQLSGGQRQRIALARALVIKPQLLICDEVTSALDPTTEAEICENVRALDGSLTIIAITHRPAWVDVADRLYELQGGVVTEASPRRLAVLPSRRDIG
jgi:ATP-binding cassette subfamily C protein